MVFVTVVSTAVFGWLEQAVLRFESDSKKVVPVAITILVLISGIILTIGVVLFVFFGGYLRSYRTFYLAAVAATIGIGAFRVLKSVFQAQLKSKQVSLYSLLKAVLKLSIGIVLSIYVFDNIVGWIWGSAIGSIIAVLVMFIKIDIDELTVSSNTARRLVWYGLPMVGWLFGLTLLTFADRALIELLSTTSDVGIYSSNYSLVQTGLPLVLSPVIQTLHPIIMDKWDGENHETVSSLIAEYSRYYLILGVAATIFAGIISRPLSRTVLGESFQSGFVIIPIIGVSLFLWNLAMIGHKGLELYESTGIMTGGVILAVTSNIVLNIFLIPPYEYVGAAFATVLSSGIYVGFAYVMSRKTVSWTIPRNTIIRVFFAGSIMSFIGYFGYISNLSDIFLCLVGIIGGIIYFLVLLAFGEFRSGEVVRVRKMLNAII
ncbi:oligosaccharide flippase family protein [Natrinema gari]|uniref:oligosaccharide flippase family protein n=1 Tax=Natrinema gari TaxID=419186 RepID=UPI0023A91A48|nr:polysaccharide biosynthesis C-terminal domain-containing protein [Natrinema gari]